MLKKNPGLFISIFCFLCGIFALVFICNKVVYSNQLVHRFVQPDGLVGHDSECKISLEIPTRVDGRLNCWQQDDGSWGAQYDIIIKNESPLEFYGWNLKINLPDFCKIDSSWNATYVMNERQIVVHPLANFKTDVIKPYDSIRLGFVLYSPALLTNPIFYPSFELEGLFKLSFWENIYFEFFLFFTALSFAFVIAFSVSIISVKKKVREAEERIYGLVKICTMFIDKRDKYTRGHSVRVAEYAKMIAKKSGRFSGEEIKNIYYAGLMHDVGKVMIPNSILCKAGSLSDSEWEEMRRHTIFGDEILKEFNDIPNLNIVARSHHERWDGMGYPDGLSGTEIPEFARVICVADSFDAMATNRAYRSAIDYNEIAAELKNNSGTQFDPFYAKIMINLIATGRVNYEV